MPATDSALHPLAATNTFVPDATPMRDRLPWVPWSTRSGADLGPSRGTVLAAIAALLLALGALVLFALYRGDSSEPGPVATDLPAVAPAPTTVVPPVSAAPTDITTLPATTAPNPPSTVLPTVSATVAPVITTVPVITTAPAQIATSLAPTAPVTTGSAGILNDPLPSGLSGPDAAPSLAVAQRLVDALSTEDWGTVRRLDRATSGYSDQNFIDGYRDLDRASLLLVDARQVPDGLRLLFVSVANEFGGAQTSLYCLEWTAKPDADTIQQHGGTVGLIARVSSTISPDDVRNDQELMEVIATRCRWS